MASHRMDIKPILQYLLFSTLLSKCLSMDNLNVTFQWRQMDFEYSSESERMDAIQSGEFIPENNIPVGLEVFKDRLFITVPRWKTGVPASLAYISLTNKTNQSPKLIPYPNWSAHRAENGSVPELISPFRVRADVCGRLWVIDSGLVNIMDNKTALSKPRLIIYNLHNDQLERQYTIPDDQLQEESFLATIAVEDTSCEDTYAYIADIGSAGLIVYSWLNKSSWRIEHHYFNHDPVSGDFNVAGLNFQWKDAIFGLALAPTRDGYSTLYFHPLASTNEFSVSTKILRNATLASDNFNDFKLVGSRGPNAQSSVEFVDKNTGVLFYALVNLNAVACWRTSNKEYNLKSQGRIFMSNETMVFPNDLKVDNDGNLWVLSDKLPVFMYSKLDYEKVNFRILTAPVEDAIRGTACGEPPQNNSNVFRDTVMKTKEGKVPSTSGTTPLGISLMLLFTQTAMLSLMFLLR